MENRKLIVLGIDGMDPKLSKRLLDEGKLPNIEKMLSVGAAREDLVMLGANPTITPPMWTTLSTGAYPMTHGITCYWNTAGNELGKLRNNFDSSFVKAEQIWAVTATAKKKTLVWTWPCSWPPVIDDANLHVVCGNCPQGPNAANALVEDEHFTFASVEYKEIQNREKLELKGGAGCIVTEDMMDRSDEEIREAVKKAAGGESERMTIEGMSAKGVDAFPVLSAMEGEEACETDIIFQRFNSPIREPRNWAYEHPEGAREFFVVVSKGLSRFPALMLKNADGNYDTIEIYESKKDKEPLVRIKEGEFYPTVETMTLKGDKKIKTTRHFTILKIDPKGDSVSVSAGAALDIETNVKEELWYPKSLYQQTLEIAGYIPYATPTGGGYPEMISRRSLPSWDVFQKWQAKALLGLIEQNDYEVAFTHNHACDHVGHSCWSWAKSREKHNYNDEKLYQSFLEGVYLQVDAYIGEFLPLLDKGWAIIVTSDHGLLCAEEDEFPFLGDGFSMNVGVLRELGYTTLKTDAEGNLLHEINWTKTKAVAPRGNHIYVNLKGRNPNGIVEPEDKYELERKIIDDLYNYRLDGKRVVNLAIRNKDAALLGLSGEECGDIIYFLEEGFNRLHGDSLSTTEGYFDTSVSPIFFAAGAGIQKGIKTDRVIREVDVAPTVAAILGVPIPAQCEGAPVYQILEKGEYKI